MEEKKVGPGSQNPDAEQDGTTVVISGGCPADQFVFLASVLIFKGSWFTALKRYSAKDLNELPAVGCHFLGEAVDLTKLLNWVMESFLNVVAAVVESLLIMASWGA